VKIAVTFMARTAQEHQMTDRNIKGKRVAILATDGVEQSELAVPR
jgi:hypothetical protein